MDAPSSSDGYQHGNNTSEAMVNGKQREPEGSLAHFLEQSFAGLSRSEAPQAQRRATPATYGHQSSTVSSSADSFAGLLLEASRNTVLSWWNQEDVECIACGKDKKNLPEDITVDDDNSSGILNHSLDAISESSSHQLHSSVAVPTIAALEVHDSTHFPEQSLPTTQRRDSLSSLDSHSSKKIQLGFALEQQLQKIKGKAESRATSSSSTQCSSSDSSDGSSGSNRRKLPENARLQDKWTNIVHRIGDVIAVVLTATAMVAARNPYICIVATVLVSVALLGTGVYFNFTLVVDNSELWPPAESKSVVQMNWLYDVSNYNYDYRYINMIVHADGENVLNEGGVARVFNAMNAIQNSSDYQEGCHWADLVGDANRVGECHIHSVSQFWNNTQLIFEEQVQTDDDVVVALTAERYPTGEPVDVARIVGNPEFGANGTILYAKSFLIEFELPWSYETEDFEWGALEVLQTMQDSWVSEDGNIFRLEVVAYRSYEDEFMRAIISDLPLLPAVFCVMCLFCCLVFWRKDRLQSRCLLGMGAVVCIFLSIMASHGLMFLLGVPFTTSTSMLPFLMFGIGLDDSFIIIGSYTRTQGYDVLKRIEMTMKEISLSIFITTFTSTLAFTLGCFSDIPAVRWLCIYAAPSVVIDFVFQITFFISLVVLDERRIEAGRMDCCSCIHVSENQVEVESSEQAQSPVMQKAQGKHWADRFMGWYANKLLNPAVQGCILVAYTGVLAGSIYATTTLTQHFDVNDMVPHDSYMRGYYNSLSSYATARTGLPSYAFFRDVDQSDPLVQEQMIQFVNDLAEHGAIAKQPTECWLIDFLKYADETGLSSQSSLNFSEKVEKFLREPLYDDIYDDHIVRDSKTGEVITSRCEVYVNVDLADAQGGIEGLELLREISSSQSINEGLDGGDWKFFTYQDTYNLWEFYSTVLEELTFSTFIGIVSVSLVAFFLIPHWTAVLFITPMIVSLYTGMLGYISYANIHVNAISYVQIIMSIGLMVDYLVHILMRYYESEGGRRERVRHTLETMGSSVFVGGVSSLLGVSLLAFSTSQILNMVFVAVIGLVVLGILHGLVFLPVILSLIGPESPKHTNRAVSGAASF